MPVTPIPHCVQFDVRMQQDGQTVQNSFYVQCTGEPTADEIESMCSAALDSWIANWKAKLNTTLSLFEIVGTSLTGLAGARVDFSVDPAEVGGEVSEPLPLNSTIALKRHGATRGKGINGRIFWPALHESVVNGDRVDTTYLGEILTAAATMNGDIATAGPTGTVACIPHKTGAHAGTSTPLIGYTASDNYIDSQRDRLPKHKRKKARRIV